MCTLGTWLRFSQSWMASGWNLNTSPSTRRASASTLDMSTQISPGRCWRSSGSSSTVRCSTPLSVIRWTSIQAPSRPLPDGGRRLYCRRSTASHAPGVRATLQVDLAQQAVDVGQQAALDVPELEVAAGVDQHQLGQHVAVGAGDLQGDVQGHGLARGAGDL